MPTKRQLKALRLAGIALISDAPADELKQCLLRLVSTFDDIPAKTFMSRVDVRDAMRARQLRELENVKL